MMKKVYKSLFCLTLPLATLSTLASVSSVRAQSITPDATLGNENSVVNTNVDVGKGIPSDRIDGGATRGNNLFHSFSNFNVDAGRGAFFANPAGIENIISRVTGGNISNILGTLGVLGNANLFFANPNGIVFGPNARLDVSGSFFATTSDSFTFDNGLEFSASNPQGAPLLAVNIPIGLRFRDNPESIINESVAVNTNNTPVGLQLFSGIFADATLALVGGEVTFDNGGRIFAPGARVEIGGLSAEGVVGINDDLSLSFPEDVARADVSFNNTARVDVRGVDRGSIIINAKDVNILGGSRLDAGILPGFGSPEAQAGDIIINATNELIMQAQGETSSAIANVVGENAQGNAGNVVINTTALEGEGRFVIGSATSGQGDAGEVTITATEKISLKGLQGAGSGISSGVAPLAVGNAKDVTVNTPSLSLSNSSQIATSTLGQGNAANIQINASKSVSINSGSVLQALSSSSGNAGKIIIEAEGADVSFDGSNTAATTSVGGRIEVSGFQFIGTGLGGDINIKARNLSVTNGAQLLTSTLGEVGASGLLPNAGKIQINVSDNIILNEGSRITSSTFGLGNAGSVTIDGIDGNLPNISFDGTNGTLLSGIFTIVGPVTPEPTEPRIGGDINITAQSLELTNGAAIDSSTSGKGNAGAISVIVDESINLANSSQIRSAVEPGAQGIGGDITLKGRSLTITDGSQVLNAVFGATRDDQMPGSGKAGNIVIDMTDFVDISGVDSFSSGLFASAEPESIATESQAAGDITVTTGDFRILDGGLVNASTANSGNGGKITIDANNFTATNGGQIVTSTFNSGNAGDIKLNITDRITIAGVNSGIFASTGEGSKGKGGNIDIDPKTVEILDGATVSAESRGQGTAGNINIVSDEILLLRRGGTISTASTTADGGSINIKTGVLVTLPNENTDITASAANQGGKITIDALGIFGFEFRSQQDLESLGIDNFSDLQTSDISATGGNPTLTGEITVNNPEIDPNNGLIELPETVVDANKQIAQNPCKQGVGSEFVATGRGGLPPNPTQDLSSSAVRVGLATPVVSNTTSTTAIQPKSTPTAKKIVPAQGWVFNSKGQVVLTAYDPNQVGVQRTAHKGLCRAK